MKDITHVELEFCATMFLAMLIITTLPLPLPPNPSYPSLHVLDSLLHRFESSFSPEVTCMLKINHYEANCLFLQQHFKVDDYTIPKFEEPTW